MKIEIDPDRANLVGITNADVSTSTAAAISGSPVGIYKEGNKNIPIVVRLRPQDRARLSQIENLYVNSSQENVKVPLLSVATLKDVLETARIRRREHFRTLSILCFPAPGVLASEVLLVRTIVDSRKDRVIGQLEVHFAPLRVIRENKEKRVGHLGCYECGSFSIIVHRLHHMIGISYIVRASHVDEHRSFARVQDRTLGHQ